jgi:lysozyme
MAIEILRRRPPSEHIVTDQAIGLIKGFEGLHLKAYPDPASELAKTGKGKGDPWTIGYGHTKGVKPGDTCTLDQANAWLREDVDEAADIVRAAVQVPLTAGEFAALVSLAYNLGYIPPSLKACLNGGVTDKGKVMTPGSYGSALLQFPRNSRAAGKVMPGLYRRRLAETCVYSDLPWENACSPTVVKVKFDASGEIDPNESTSLEDTLMRARLDTSRPPDTSHILKKPWSELVKKAEPEAVQATGEAEPAEKEAPQPNPPLVSAPVPIEKPALRGPAPATAGGIVVASPPTTPVKPAPPPKLPDPPVPIGQQTGAVDAARKSEEWSSNAKSMIYSRRFWGLLLVVAGRVWMLKTGSNAVLGAVSDPLVMEMFSGFMVMIIGEIIQHIGERKATRPLK